MQENSPSNHNLQIPVIDLPQSGGDEDTGTALVDACAKYGFVFVRGEGLGFSFNALDEAFELVRGCHPTLVKALL